VSPQAWAAEKMALDIIQVQQFLTDVSATHNDGGYQEAEEFAVDFKKTITQFRENKLSSAQLEELSAIEQAFEAFYNTGKRMAAAYISGGTQSGNVIMEEFDQTSLALAERMTKFRDAAVSQEKTITSAIATSADDTANYMMVLAVFGLLVSVFIALYLTQLLAKQLGIDPFFRQRHGFGNS